MSPLFNLRPFPAVSEHPDVAPDADLRTFGTTAGSATTGAATTSSTAGATTAAAGTEMPTETGGPYPGDGSNGPDVLEITAVQRSDIRTSIDGSGVAEGVPVTLTMQVIDMANNNAAFAGADGTVTFTTIFPGCYDGRWPHLHFEVFPDVASITDVTNNVLTSQIAMPESECAGVYATSTYTGSASNLTKVSLATDNVFSDGWTMQVPITSGSATAGYTMSIDTTTAQAAAASPGGPAGRR